VVLGLDATVGIRSRWQKTARDHKSYSLVE
jgi:hypothetical protein